MKRHLRGTVNNEAVKVIQQFDQDNKNSQLIFDFPQ